MPGLGQQYLPRPQFSLDNPYWRIPEMGFRIEYRPRLSARDFLYATSWEINRRFDVHGANCVRVAMQRSFWVNLRLGKVKNWILQGEGTNEQKAS